MEEEGGFWILGTADHILWEVQPEGLRMVESPESKGQGLRESVPRQVDNKLITSLGSPRRRKGSGT